MQTSPSTLESDDSVKFLGVFLDPGLTWKTHVSHLSSKLSKITFLIRSLSRNVSKNTLLVAYHGYFCSNMSYAVLNWGHSPNSLQIFKLQRRCVRIIANVGYRDCCRDRFVELGLLTFPCIFIFQCLVYVKENQDNFITHRVIHSYSTRNGENLVPSYHRLQRTRRGADFYGINFFNVLPTHIKNLNLEQFKKKVRSCLISGAFYSFEEYLESDLNLRF